jgi:hypothetical protein
MMPVVPKFATAIYHCDGRTDGVVSEVFNHGAGGNNKKLFHCHFRHCVAAVAAAAATEEAWSGLGIG